MSYGPGRPGNGLFDNKFPPDVPLGLHGNSSGNWKIELAVAVGFLLLCIVVALLLPGAGCVWHR